jgi:hypothetical protein
MLNVVASRYKRSSFFLTNTKSFIKSSAARQVQERLRRRRLHQRPHVQNGRRYR